MKHEDGAVRVAQIFQFREFLADGLGGGVVFVQDGLQHRGGAFRRDADAASGESCETEVAHVHDGGLFADAADDEFRIDEFDELFEPRILLRILDDDGVFDPTDESVIHERGGEFRRDVTGIFDVKHGRHAGFFHEVTHGRRDASGLGREERGQQHRGGIFGAAQHFRLIHRGAIHRPDGGHDPHVLRREIGEHGEQALVFADADVVEIRVATVQQRADATFVEMADETAVLRFAERELRVPAERRDGDDGGNEVGVGGGRGLHESGGETGCVAGNCAMTKDLSRDEFRGGLVEGSAHAGGIARGLQSGALDEQDVNAAGDGINPALRAMRAAVAVSAGAERGGDADGLHDDLKAESHAHAIGESGFEIAGVIAGHELEAFLADEALLFHHAAIEEHLVELHEILRGGEETACGKRSAFFAGVRLGEVANGRGFERFAVRGGFVGGGELLKVFFGRPEGGGAHAERIEEAFFEEARVFHAADDFDDAAEGVDAGIAVGPLGAGLELQGRERVGDDGFLQTEHVERVGIER